MASYDLSPGFIFSTFYCAYKLVRATLARCHVSSRRKCRALPIMIQADQERRAWNAHRNSSSAHQSSFRDA